MTSRVLLACLLFSLVSGNVVLTIINGEINPSPPGFTTLDSVTFENDDNIDRCVTVTDSLGNLITPTFTVSANSDSDPLAPLAAGEYSIQVDNCNTAPMGKGKPGKASIFRTSAYVFTSTGQTCTSTTTSFVIVPSTETSVSTVSTTTISSPVTVTTPDPINTSTAAASTVPLTVTSFATVDETYALCVTETVCAGPGKDGGPAKNGPFRKEVEVASTQPESNGYSATLAFGLGFGAMGALMVVVAVIKSQYVARRGTYNRI